MTTITAPRGRIWSLLLIAVIVLLAAPFVIYAARFGFRGLTADLSGETYLFTADAPLANAAIFAHMATGAIITLLAPFQLVAPIRERAPRVHRWSGWLIAALAIPTALGGLGFIGLRGTIGGPAMDVAFAGYGALVLIAAIQTPRHARARRFDRHWEWGLRLFVLAIASWLYRLHYWLWHLATGGMWSNEDFSGAFDRINLFAFYVPYLVGLEIWFRTRRASAVD